MGDISDKDAAMAWTRIAEGNDPYAVRFIESVGYVQAYQSVKDYCAGSRAPDGLETAIQRWAHRFNEDEFKHDKEKIDDIGGGFLYPHDEAWTQSFELLENVTPLGLWYVGEKNLMRSRSVSIVGSRDCTEYGRSIAYDFAYELAENGISIVSGGAFGIDAAAHRGVLAVPSANDTGRPIVVFASGLGNYYPRGNKSLFEAIADSGGLFVSEYPPFSSPHRHRFLSRNRIIAALGLATLVVEAPYRSGALSTAHHAVSIGRDVCVVPGSIYSPHSRGCHRLLREGALCVTTVKELVESLPQWEYVDDFSEHTSPDAPSAMSLDKSDPMAGDPYAVRVRDGLCRQYGRSVDDVAREVGLSPRETLSALAMLEMGGIAKNHGGRWVLSPDL